MKKKLLCVLLTICMLFGMVPTVAYAGAPVAQWGLAGADGAAPTDWVDSGTMQEAINYACGLTSGTAYIQLLSNVTRTNNTRWPLYFVSSNPSILDLNGKNIDRGLTAEVPDGNVITVEGELTLLDSSTNIASNQGCITGGFNDNTGGGGISLFSTSTLIMQGGNITGNKSTNRLDSAGGVYLVTGAKMEMTGGRISGNESSNRYGGIFAEAGSVVKVTGGSIDGNSGADGGVYIDTDDMSVGGTAVIEGNLITGTTTERNIVLRGNKLDVLPLSTGARIGISLASPISAGGSVDITNSNPADYSSYFFSDQSEYMIRNGSGNVIQMTTKPSVTIGNLSIPDSFTAGTNLSLSDMDKYKPTVTKKDGTVIIMAEGWKVLTTSAGGSESSINWAGGVLPVDTSSTFKLSYYANCQDGYKTTSNEVTLNVVGHTTSLAISASPSSPQKNGTPVTLAATLTGFFAPAGVVTQAITFKNDGTVLGTANLDASGVATYDWTPSSAGTYKLTAEYGATAYNTSATSNQVDFVTTPSDEEVVDAARLAAQNAIYADMTQAVAVDKTVIKNALKATAEAAIKDSSVTVDIFEASYVAPVSGTAGSPSGTNGKYVFYVNLFKDKSGRGTAELSINITATPFTGLTDAQAVTAAKAAVVDGNINVAFGADQTTKTAAVQSYVNGLLTGDAAGVTAIVTFNSGTGKYDVTLSKGTASDTKNLTMNITLAADPDISIISAAKLAAQNATYGNMTQGTAADENAIIRALKSTAEAAINNNGVTVTVNRTGYTPSVAGTSSLPSGTNGSYTFTITVSKGAQSAVTDQKTITITATAYTGGSGGSGGGSDSNKDRGTVTTPSAPSEKPVEHITEQTNKGTTDNSGSTGTSGSNGNNSPASSEKGAEPVTGSVENKAVVDGKGTAKISVTEQDIRDAVADAKAEAAKNGFTAGDIKVVLDVSTSGKNASNISVSLPKTIQQQIIDNHISEIELAIDRPDITVGLDLAAVTEINKQADADVQLTVDRARVPVLNTDAKKVIGNRPVYNFEANYENGAKSVTNFGSGKVFVSIPYTPAKDEMVGYLNVVYVDETGKATRIPGSAYDGNTKCLIFETTHFSTYGVSYAKPITKYSDVQKHWAKDSIDYVMSRGLITGKTKAVFSPNTAMTRGELMSVLGKLAEINGNLYVKNSFSDVKANASYRPYIEWAVEKKIIKGIDETTFGPERPVTRQELAVIMEAYLKAMNITLPTAQYQSVFADDSSISIGYSDAVKSMQQAGILRGKANNKFDPKASATRAEVCAMLHRFIKLTINASTAQGWTMNDAGQSMYVKEKKLATGWLEIEKKWYYFNKDGSMAKNTKIDGQKIGPDGVCKTKKA